MTTVEDRDYLPAMATHMPAAFYDPFTRLLGVRDAHWRLVAQAGIEPGATVLEIGCGTGNLLLLAARAVPGATLIGLDPDPARPGHRRPQGAAGRGELRLDRGYADRLPYPDGSVDRVLSAFMLHHLPAAQQHEALREVRRVLAPGRATAPARHRRQPAVGGRSAAAARPRPHRRARARARARARGGPARPRHARHGARRAARRRPDRRRRRRARRDAAGRLQLLPRLALNRPQSTGR